MSWKWILNKTAQGTVSLQHSLWSPDWVQPAGQKTAHQSHCNTTQQHTSPTNVNVRAQSVKNVTQSENQSAIHIYRVKQNKSSQITKMPIRKVFFQMTQFLVELQCFITANWMYKMPQQFYHNSVTQISTLRMIVMIKSLKSCVNHFTTVTALTDRALLCVCYGKTVLLMLGAVCMASNGHTAHFTESEIHLTNFPESCIWDLMSADQTVTKHQSTCSKSSAITLYVSFPGIRWNSLNFPQL